MILRIVRGFTLIELSFSMALIALLASIAWPGYQQAVHRALRQDARLALLRIQHRQERHFSEHLAYLPSLADVSRSDDGNYLMTLTTSAGGHSYVAIARIDPARRQARDLPCAYLSIDETGRRRSADISGIWRDADPERCWG